MTYDYDYDGGLNIDFLQAYSTVQGGGARLRVVQLKLLLVIGVVDVHTVGRF